MGKNTPTRQEFIIDNLRIEKDEVGDSDKDKEPEEQPVNSPSEVETAG